MIYLRESHKISNIQPSSIVPLRMSFRFFQHRTISLLVVDLPWNTTNHPIPISFVCNDSILSSIYVIWWYLKIISWKLEMVPVFHLLNESWYLIYQIQISYIPTHCWKFFPDSVLGLQACTLSSFQQRCWYLAVNRVNIQYQNTWTIDYIMEKKLEGMRFR